jgi:hypothetical protein
MRRLKAGKGDGNQHLFSDHLINGGGVLHEFLALLFNCMMIHGYSPPALLSSVMIAIPKDRRASLCNSSNYRSIALSSSICKLLDIVILMKYQAELATSELQFGFKPKHSTVLCTAIFKEIVQHFTDRGTNVYSVFLDASKAFDRVHYGKLFQLLIDRNLSPLLIRMLLYIYVHQNAAFKWNGTRSESFTLRNGVKQGGVLSPVLFTVYFDHLLAALKSKGIGCHVKDCYAGVLCYADDVTIMCPSLLGLNKMLAICCDFGKEYNVTFNAKKTVAVCFGKTNVSGFPVLNREKLAWSDGTKYLGNKINSSLSDSDDCNYKMSQFIGSVNKLYANFGSMHSHTKYKLFNSYCCTFHGSQMWRLSCSDIVKIGTQWNKALRRLMHLPWRTHTWVLGPLFNSLHIRTQFEIRTAAFICKLFVHTNPLVQTILYLAHNDARTGIGSNIAHFRFRYGISTFNNLKVCKNKIASANTLTDEHFARVLAAQELIACKESSMYVEHFSPSDVNTMLEGLLCD